MSDIARHIADHQRTVEALAAQAPLIERMGEAMIRCLADRGCIFWLGNGGSAADCQHLAAELVGRFERERRGFASVALTTDSSILTSVGNDYGFEAIFARQVEALARPGDLVIGISTSGNSPNVLRALEAAAAKGVGTIGLSGRDGGALADLADICLIVPDESTARIQEAHILVGHILCDLVEAHFADHHPGRQTPPADESRARRGHSPPPQPSPSRGEGEADGHRRDFHGSAERGMRNAE